MATITTANVYQSNGVIDVIDAGTPNAQLVRFLFPGCAERRLSEATPSPFRSAALPSSTLTGAPHRAVPTHNSQLITHDCSSALHSRQIRPRLSQRCLRSQPILLPQSLHLAMLNKLIRPSHPNHWHSKLKIIHRLQHRRAKPARQHMVFKRHQQPAMPSKLFDTSAVNRLPQTADSPPPPRSLHAPASSPTASPPVASRRFGRAMATSVPILNHLDHVPISSARGCSFTGVPRPNSTRIPYRRRSIMQHRRIHHVRKLVLVLRNHVHNIRHAPQIADVEQPMMRRPIVAAQSAAVHTEHHRQILQANIMHHLVESALQKCRVDRTKRLIPA